ncbi:transposase, partial [Escherichia coli]|nr:transposase [Escherichia coli]MDA6890274.1 transposase [Escherichia coli]
MLTSEQHRCHNEKRNFSAEFKRESAQLVVDQKYTVADAASAMDVGLSTMTRWVKQLRDERQGKTPKASPITPEQIEIRELRKKLQRIEGNDSNLLIVFYVQIMPDDFVMQLH